MTLHASQLAEIEAQRQSSFTTRRTAVDSLEEILFTPLPVLDHGFVRVIDYMGNDEAIVQAARVSYGKGTKKLLDDQGLINYLLRHRHTTPFEMCEIKFHIKLPIFIARQWIRHRTANVNEYSARYSLVQDEFYIPASENLAAQSNNNRQGRGESLSPQEAEEVQAIIQNNSIKAYEDYERLLNSDQEGNIITEDKQGIARELARIALPVNTYTEWYWKIDLHNLLHFLSLRADPHAQYEIRAYAEVMLDVVKRWVPFTYDAFTNHRLQGAQFSREALTVIKQLIEGKEVSQTSSKLSKREWQEVMSSLGLED